MNEMESSLRSESAVVLQDVTKSYSKGKDKSYVLRHCNMTIKRGTIYGLLGPSGCGKTTILKCILGNLPIDEGCVTVFGSQSDDGVPLELKIGYMPQDIGLSSRLTVNETVQFFGTFYGMKKSEIVSKSQFLLNFLHIKLKERNTLIENLSGGQKRRVSFVLALLNNPHLLILDEPTVGVDPTLRKKIWDHLFNVVNETNATVIITTHYIEEARMAQNVGLLYKGRLLVEAPPRYVIEKYGCQSLEHVFMKLCKAVDNNTTDEIQRHTHNYVEQEQLMKADDAETTKRYIKFAKEDNELLRWNKIKALCIKNMLFTYHHKTIVLAELLLPIILIIIFCASLGNPIFGVPLGVINHDSGNLSHMFLDSISDYTITQIPYDNIEDGFKDYSKANIAGYITVQQNFSSMMKRVLDGDGILLDDVTLESGLILVTMASHVPQVFIDVNTELADAYKKFSRNLLNSYGLNPIALDGPFQLNKQQVYEIQSENAFNHYLLPAFIVLVSFFFPLGAITLYLIAERKEGSFDRLVLTGVTLFEFIIGYYPVAAVVIVMQVLLMMVTIYGVYGYTCVGSYYLVFVMVFSLGICTTNLGFFISSICKDEISGLTICFSLFMIFLASQGIFWPLESLGNALGILFSLLPIARPLEAVRCIMIRGWGLLHLKVCLGFLTCFVWSTVFIVLAGLLLRRKFK